jgi:hypothetical protein
MLPMIWVRSISASSAWECDSPPALGLTTFVGIDSFIFS